MSNDNKPLIEGDAFERLAECHGNYPQPGDRYLVRMPWGKSTGLSALGRVKGKHFATEFTDSLRNDSKWTRIDVAALPSMLDVLVEELATLRCEGWVRA